MSPREELASAMEDNASPEVFGEKIIVDGVEYSGIYGPPAIGLEYLPGKALRKVEFTVLVTKAQLPVRPAENTPCEGRGYSLRIGKLDDAHVSWRLHLTNAKA